jgi:hypothetical protein
MEEQFTMTLQAASIFAGLSVRTLQRLIGRGLLRSTTIGKRRLVFKDSLVKLLNKGVPRE